MMVIRHLLINSVHHKNEFLEQGNDFPLEHLGIHPKWHKMNSCSPIKAE